MKLKLLVSVITFALLTINVSAQYTIGADNGINAATSYPTPFGDYFKTMRAQYLYRSVELISAGMSSGFITEISYTVENLPATTGATEGYIIKLIQTGVASLGTTTWQPGATIVWGPVDYTPILGVNTFVLDVPFLWDGTSNVIVEICGGSSLVDYTKNARVTWTGPLGFNASRTRVSDIETNPCAYTGTEYSDYTPGGPDYRPQVIFNTTPADNCADLPIIGAASSTEASVCAYEPFTVSVTPIAEFGIIYSWSSSPDGITWTTIPGAITASYAATQTAASYYRCTVTCTLSGDNSNSGTVFVGMNDPGSCICLPTYVTGTAFGDYISRVELGAIVNVTGALPAPYYYFYNLLSTNLTAGTSNTIAVKMGTYINSNGFAAWIDYNQDGVFVASEKLGEVTGLLAAATGNVTFTVPVTATEGVTRMRVRESWNTVGIDPCIEYGYGEAEDYNVNIVLGVPPLAAFSYTGDPTVLFTDLSTGTPTSWSWNFGDGGISTLENPVRTYALNGVYNVCLTATSALGSNTSCQNVTIDSYLPPVADFSYSGDPILNFVDLSTNTPTSWNWSFGDGGTSTLENPSHNYLTNGSFYVCLTATNALGSNTNCEFVNVFENPIAPIAEFTFTGDPVVAFTDLSLNEPTSWSWNFGDGGSSILENPTHTYAANGTYDVCLTATNVMGSSTSCQAVTISTYAVTPVAAFTYAGGPTVVFTDLSTNTPTSWSWDFGDGGTSTLQNPVHLYATNGTYTVCLTASNFAGSDSECDNIIVNAYAPPVADFNFAGDPLVIFTDLSTNDPATWLWNFDDGGVSIDQNPSHTYTVNGIYNVCLSVTGPGGSDTHCRDVAITANGTAPSTDFSFEIVGLTAIFTDLSTNEPDDWFWDFADGAISGLQNPTHTYAVIGLYNVCLTTTNPFGTNTNCKIIDLQSGVEHSNINIITMYPNPAESYTIVTGDAISNGYDNVSITNIVGQSVNTNGLITIESGALKINTAQLPAGNYTINITQGDQLYIGKFIKL